MLIVAMVAAACAGCARSETVAQSAPPSAAKAFTGTPDQLARLGARTFAQMDCAALASFSEQQAEHERLFNAGMETGRSFLQGVRAAQEAKMDLDKAMDEHLPMIVGGVMGGPTDDFILGRLWEATVQYEGDKLYEKVGDSRPDGDLVKMRAANGYRDANCAQL